MRAFAAKAGYRQMGTTVTILVADPEDGRSAAVGNIGDSRVYRLREGELKQLTRDHTMEREILRRRSVRQVDASVETRASMLSHVLTRAVGVGNESKLDWRKIDMHAGDVFLVCSDGVYGFVKPDALKAALASGEAAKDIVRRIGDLVLEGGAGDNYSAIVVKIGGRA